MIRPDSLEWHVGLARPADVVVNGVTWDITDRVTRLKNRGVTRVLPPGIYFGRARLTKRGRGNVELTPYADRLVLQFRDTAPGAGEYQVQIDF